MKKQGRWMAIFGLLTLPLAAAELPAAIWQEISPPDAPSVRTVLFEPCRAVLNREALEVIRRHALYLKNHPELGIRLVGHSDDRASRAYNLALAFQRAKAVADTLKLYDVEPQRITLLPYGEEKPQADGRARRVEFIYLRRR